MSTDKDELDLIEELFEKPVEEIEADWKDWVKSFNKPSAGWESFVSNNRAEYKQIIEYYRSVMMPIK